ncbi:hypothetical protein W97_09329 [Coniosporium apollinis CBS 100218]|uniref:Uncharacterized protein n=1 Tax=Coniosporium apollinis (strain CBS 100218) TaxID=1168221 RepID=R7Z7H3_CONA1|nr:uncharacterized protein W97_09329 [Coniosporium apollinis CBS 100218]EON70063.1 hypothetical protein W97_09329 [Coniosporium apollinis CBS 100218]
MSVGTIVSFLGTGIGLLSFITSNFPEKDNSGGAGGDLPDVRLFGEGGTFLGGTYDPGHINDGAAGVPVNVG